MLIKITPTPLKLFVLLGVLIAQSFVSKLGISESMTFLSFIDEIVVLYCAPYAAYIAIKYFKTKPMIRVFVLLLLVYWAFSLSSSLFGMVSLSQALYQFVLDLKYFIIFFFCLGAYKSGVSERYADQFFKVLLLLNIPLVFIQIIAPSFYDSIFSLGSHHGVFQTISGSNISRAAGIFWFTGEFAFFASIAAGYFLMKLWYLGGKKSDKLFFLISLFLLASTLSRGEIASFIVACAVTYVLFFTNKKYLVVHFSLAVFGLFILVLFNQQLVYSALSEMGIVTSALEVAPRAKFMAAAIAEANENLPFGAGLGALGGQAAVVFDSDLFYKHGFQYEWYFNHGMFLTDTYWPKVLAESGWVGSAMLFVIYCYIPYRIFKHSNFSNYQNAFTFFGMTVLLLNSATSPVYNAVLLVFLTLIMSGNINEKYQR